MSESNEETRAASEGETPVEDTQAGQSAGSNAPGRRSGWIRLLVGGWLLLILTAAVSGYSGYLSGTEARAGTQTAEAVSEVEHQYQLGLEELVSMECDRARQRFEWVIEQNPDHVGAIDSLARAITCLNATATPTPLTPTAMPTLTPTPDLRSAEEKFEQARAAMAAESWDEAINTLFSLRQEDPDFMPVEVDSMLYVAFRNRGVAKILNTAELESGLYDLSQAELFGPLDSEAITT